MKKILIQISTFVFLATFVFAAYMISTSFSNSLLVTTSAFIFGVLASLFSLELFGWFK